MHSLEKRDVLFGCKVMSDLSQQGRIILRLSQVNGKYISRRERNLRQDAESPCQITCYF